MADIKNNTETLDHLTSLMKENNLYELSIDTPNLKINLKSKKPEAQIQQPAQFVMPPFAGFPPVSGVPAGVPASNAPAAPAPAVRTGNVVTTPIIGTFYGSPSPDKPPFVKVGDTVKKGQIICIIESMKLMNELPSEFDGTVTEILLKDGTPVEFGQELMVIQ
jgi:acetyl-CoA carboxylase biotin carboxyl carrier protein